ncbi:MAG: DUF2723 domain-containing protein [Bacteroidales bacterium]|nr:DUF2723 domain-containing protein [Bacteroidales bacterium]
MGWLVGLGVTSLYLLTLEPSFSFWDCGEFIATSYLLQVGHPPGAPFYSLCAHLFSLLSLGHVERVAFWCNSLSAVAGGATAMLLFWTLLTAADALHFARPAARWGALVGAATLAVCDTTWFSAVESEVYSLALLLAAAIVWAAARWWHRPEVRWLWLIGLLAGLAVCTHLLALLALPAVALAVAMRVRGHRPTPHRLAEAVVGALLFFLIGLTPLLITPIRASADPPLNECAPDTAEKYLAYLRREQYEQAPLYPRLWRNTFSDPERYAAWLGHPTDSPHGTVGENVRFAVGYQMGYMYLRYFMWNFSGRFNDRQGYGSLQNGQFVTGLPLVDRGLVGSAAAPPDALVGGRRQAYFLLPLLLGAVGIGCSWRRSRRLFWLVTTLFLMSGPVLNIYLNHPLYEPRERDYAYVLSFFAFCLFVGVGGMAVASRWRRAAAVLLAVPLWMGIQNWPNHDRSGRLVPHDIAAAHLHECPPNALLLTVGDNDTFPLWCLQQVEGMRRDVQIVNLNLLATDWYARQTAHQLARQGTPLLPCDADSCPVGLAALQALLENNTETAADGSTRYGRPVVLSRYAADYLHEPLDELMLPVGFTCRLFPTPPDDDRGELLRRSLLEATCWHPMRGVYVDEVSQRFLDHYASRVAAVAAEQVSHAPQLAVEMMDSLLAYIPMQHIEGLRTLQSLSETYDQADAPNRVLSAYIEQTVEAQRSYYRRLSPAHRRLIPYTLEPLREVYARRHDGADCFAD